MRWIGNIIKEEWLKPRVLIFEDNDILRFTLKNILDDLGYEVHAFSNPGMCPLYYSSSHSCLSDYSCSDIVITDVNMPVETGVDKQIKYF